MTSLPTNWWLPDEPREIPTAPHSSAEVRRRDPTPAPAPSPPAPAPAASIEWMRPQTENRGAIMTRNIPAKYSKAIAAADRMVDVGERLLLWLVGACIGSALVVAVNALVGA